MSLLDRIIKFGTSGSDVGIDLGTTSVIVYVKGQGIVLKEPSVVAFDKDSGEIKAIGASAYKMIGKTPENIVAVRPLKEGVISDYEVTEKMLSYFIEKALTNYTFVKPRVCVCIPSNITEVERKAVEQAIYASGVRDVKLIEEPIAAAIGAGIDVSKPRGNLIVDIGGGTTDVAIVSVGGAVVQSSLKIAGDNFNEDIINMVKDKYNLLIGEGTAEKIKIAIGCCYPNMPVKATKVRGRNIINGMPETVVVTSEDVEDALRNDIDLVVQEIIKVLEQTPPELSADIIDKGIMLTGGGALIRGLDKLINEKTGMVTQIAESPLTAVAIGTGKYVEIINKL